MTINNYYHITDTGAGDKSGDSWANAMDEAAFETHLEGAVVAGDVHFVMDGSYTLDSDIDCSARDGTGVSPIAIIGVKSGTTNEGANVVYSDWSRDSADRPFFDGVTYQFRLGDYYVVRNISYQSSNTIAFRGGNRGYVENCKFDNDVGTSGTNEAIRPQITNVVNCEITSANAKGTTSSNGVCFAFCYFYDFTDSTNGVAVTSGTPHTLVNNIFDNCATIGINVSASASVFILNNTFYECGIGVSASTALSAVAINNIMEGNDNSGFKWTTQTDSILFWKNHGDDARCTDMWNGVDTTTVYQDYEVTTGDPLFTTPGSDHSLGNGSPCIDTGQAIENGAGSATMNKGAWQNPAGVGGGGLLVHPGMNGGING